MLSNASSKSHSFTKPATILVTGGSGFIGRHVVTFFQFQGHPVRVLDLVPTNAAECIVGDVSDPAAVRRALSGVDAVVHLAAQASVQKAIAEPALTRRSNVDGTHVVLEQARAAGVKKVVFASSCAVYGHAAPPLSEEVPVSPLSLYAGTKVEGETLCRSYSEKDLPCVALRFFNVYGPGQKRDSDYAAVIPAFIHAANEGKPLTIYGDGTASRDFVSVADVVQAVQRALDFPEPFGVFNVGSGTATTVKELAERIVLLTRSSSKIVHAPGRSGEVRFSWADPTRAKKELGFEAAVGLEEGLKRILLAKGTELT